MFCGVVIERRRLFLDVGVGRVGVGRRGEQVGIRDIARTERGGRRGGRNRAGVERGEACGAAVDRERSQTGSRSAGRLTVTRHALRARSPGSCPGSRPGSGRSGRAAARRWLTVTPGSSVSSTSTPVSGSACSL